MEIERIYRHTLLQERICVTCVKKKKGREGERETGVRPLVYIVLMSSGTQKFNTQLWLEVIVVLPKYEYRKKKKKKEELNTAMSLLSQSNQ